MSSKIRVLSTAGFIFIGIVVGIIITSKLDWIPEGIAGNPEVTQPIGSTDDPSDAVLQLQNTGKAFTAVSKEVLPTVVSIATSKIIRRSSTSEGLNPLLREFFGRDFNFRPETQRLQGLGSGVIVSKDGYILTNNHVIENADDIKVTLYDNRYFDAELVGTDPLTEIAVIKIDGKDLPVARLGDSDRLEVGEWVLAIGNPFQLNSTVTAGIVSAMGRSINIIQDENASESGGSFAIENFIQTDAAINPGNSGGALVNLKAEVIGINTAIATQTGGYQGYGFAVPINLASKIRNDLIKQGYVVRAYIGIGMRTVDDVVAQRYNMDRPRGVYIDQVMDDSPAQKAGLKMLDIIVKLDGQEVNQSNEIQNAIALKNPGDVVTLTILRDGVEKDIKIKLGQRETGREETEQRDDESHKLGLTVQELTNDIRSQLESYRSDNGVLVTEVEPYSAAYDAGIRRGHLITKIEDKTISTLSDYRRAIRSYNKGDVVIFYMKRGDAEYHAFVKMPE